MNSFVIYKNNKEDQMLINKQKTLNIKVYKMNQKKSNNCLNQQKKFKTKY